MVTKGINRPGSQNVTIGDSMILPYQISANFFRITKKLIFHVSNFSCEQNKVVELQIGYSLHAYLKFIYVYICIYIYEHTHTHYVLRSRFNKMACEPLTISSPAS